MTLLHVDGFEAGDYTARGYLPAASTLARTTAGTRFGYGAAVGIGNTSWTHPVTASSKVTVGYAFWQPTLPGGAQNLVMFCADSGATNHVAIVLGANGAISGTRNGTVIGSPSAAGLVAATTWNYLEATATVADSGGVIVVRLNGTEVVNVTGDTKNAGTSTLIDMVRFYTAGSVTPTLWDDMYILNDLGAAPWNAPLGDCRVQTLVPTGAGALTQLTPTGSANNWENVDEQPPVMTDYNASATAGQRDTYAMTDLVLGTTTILGVAANTSALKNDAGARSIIPVVRVGSTVYPGTTRALSTTVQTQSSVWQTNPATSAAWTPTEVEATEAGLEVV